MIHLDFSDSEMSDSRAAIRTYSNYSAAWCLRAYEECSPRVAQMQLGAFSQLQPSPQCDRELVRQHLIRGNLTLKLIEGISVDERPDFAMVSALWLPVQAYYAIHGFGMACLAAKHGSINLPQTHQAFMRQAADSIVQHHFPTPFSAVLRAGYKGYRHLEPALINIPDDRLAIGSGHNLERPNQMTRDAHIAQCLDTTRRRLIYEKTQKERRRVRKPGKKYGVLNKEKHIHIAQNIPPTTILDYLYRVRIKSNYEDPTMFHEGSAEADELLEFVRNTKQLALTLCTLLAAILYQTLSEPDRKEIERDVKVGYLLEK